MRYALSLCLAGLALVYLPRSADSASGPPAVKKPKVEVVFCLDTTGSMTGLIEGAKAKIWSICNQIASGKPIPDLKVGLVAYRDRGDDYVTKVFDLSADLDDIHGHLRKFQAKGGGDTPESVNQALYDAVHKIKWSSDKKTLKIIFLVGDAPPHMDYKDDVKYPDTCKKAVEKDIIVNTIQCGRDPECTRYWKDIAVKSEGSFVAIAQDGGVKVVSTPFDAKLQSLNRELTKTVLVYGDKDQKATDTEKNRRSMRLDPEMASSRIGYQAKNAQVATYCLLDSIKQGRVKLENVKKDQLPDAMKKMTLKEQKEYLAKLENKRKGLNKEVLELDRKRIDWIAKKQAEEKKKGGFDGKVLDVLRKQAKRANIKY